MQNRLPLIAIFLAVTTLSGCVTGGGFSRSGGESLNQQVNRHEQQIQSILSQVGQVEQVLPGQAEMWSQMQSMRQELNALHGQVDMGSSSGDGSIQARVERLEATVHQMASQMGIPFDTQAPAPTVSVTPVPTGGASNYTPPVIKTPQSPSTTTASKPTSTAQIVYDSGIKAFDKRDYKGAVSIFKDFATSYPKHNLASNAIFWQGESYYQLKDYSHATLAYQDVIDKFPGSSKVQSAMLKQGMSLYLMGKKEAGKERLTGLITRYPNSMESTRAKNFMESNK